MSSDLPPFAESGYESDTGERDLPTCANFKTREPVQKTIEVGPSKKVLNRKGRAICRIVHSHGWSATDIAAIFRVSATSVSRAIDNIRYRPRDRISEDYMKVDVEFEMHFPPIAVKDNVAKLPKVPSDVITIDSSDDELNELDFAIVEEYRSNGRPPRTAKGEFYSNLPRGLASEEDETPVVPQKRSHEHEPVRSSPTTSNMSSGRESSTSVSGTKKPRYDDEHSDIRTTSTGPFISSFRGQSPSLRQTSTFRTTHMSKSGAPPHDSVALSASRSTLATAGAPPRVPASSAVQTSRIQAPPLPHRSLLAPRAHSSTPTLSSFLKNIPGIDLSAHHALLEAQGFSVARMHILGTWGRDAIKEVLQRLLMESEAASMGHKGMDPLELITLELGIRKLKAPNTSPSRSVLPSPLSNPHSSAVTLASFLKNVMGFDFSAHHNLLKAQGFDVARLSTIAASDREDIREILDGSLRADVPGFGGMKAMKAMTALEVLALEFALRDVA
ncbi:hypothetical protein B0H11DRAFT_2093086 [Mycena galericulata]|nr:hypothetical protein B0H11DRAFT_2093086 [Mycena galericulata]